MKQQLSLKHNVSAVTFKLCSVQDKVILVLNFAVVQFFFRRSLLKVSSYTKKKSKMLVHSQLVFASQKIAVNLYGIEKVIMRESLKFQ